MRVRRALWLFVGLPLLAVVLLPVGLFVLMLVAEYIELSYYAARPEKCWLAEWLPPEGVATRCDMSMGIDFEDTFEARLSEAGAAEYQRRLLGSLKNPRILDGSGLNVRLVADGEIDVSFSWDNGVLTVIYGRS